MKKRYNFYLMLALMSAFVACNNDPDEEPMNPMEPEEPELTFMDTATLEEVVINLDNYIPTWEELERFTNDAVRLSIPAYEKRALGWYGVDPGDIKFDPMQPWMPQVMAYDQSLIDDFGANMSSSIMSPLPPHILDDGSEIPFPMPPEILDIKLRGATALFLYEKSLGRPVTFVQFYPPHEESELFETRQEFETWFENVFLPEKEAEARAAEIMKAEKFMPWPLELEVLTRDWGGEDNGGFLDGASEEEWLEFATSIKDRILSLVKTHYHGRVVAHLYNNYHLRPEAHFWDRMDYTGFDEIHFAFFPPFDVEGTNAYMDEQLIHYTKILQNSGNIPWVASEVSVFEWYVQDGKMLEFEKGMYEAAFNKLESAPVPPKGISAAGGYMVTESAKDYVKNFFDQH